MQKKSILKYGIYFFSLILLMMTGCNKFKGDQEVPAYIQIDSITVTPAFGLNPTAKIVDAWVTVDGWNIGAYQLPLRIPVLKRGEHKVLIQAGILANNLSLRRHNYPFYSGKLLTVNLMEDSIVYITRKDTIMNGKNTAIIKPIEVELRDAYKSLLLNEDFERGKHSFDTASTFGSVLLEIKQCHTVPTSTPERLYGDHVGLIHLEKGDSCCIWTKEIFKKGTETELPFNQPIFVEIDYLTNNIFEVGIVSMANQKKSFHSVVVVGSQRNPEWSKIYVDISNAVTSKIYEGVNEFQIFIRADLEEDNPEANIYLDNIRLVFTPLK